MPGPTTSAEFAVKVGDWLWGAREVGETCGQCGTRARQECTCRWAWHPKGGASDHSTAAGERDENVPQLTDPSKSAAIRGRARTRRECESERGEVESLPLVLGRRGEFPIVLAIRHAEPHEDQQAAQPADPPRGRSLQPS
jgi:hypothetical protein